MSIVPEVILSVLSGKESMPFGMMTARLPAAMFLSVSATAVLQAWDFVYEYCIILK